MQLCLIIFCVLTAAPKKGNLQQCQNYRTISLISQLKTGCKIICGVPTTLAVKGLIMMMMIIIIIVGSKELKRNGNGGGAVYQNQY